MYGALPLGVLASNIGVGVGRGILGPTQSFQGLERIVWEIKVYELLMRRGAGWTPLEAQPCSLLSRGKLSGACPVRSPESERTASPDLYKPGKELGAHFSRTLDRTSVETENWVLPPRSLELQRRGGMILELSGSGASVLAGNTPGLGAEEGLSGLTAWAGCAQP